MELDELKKIPIDSIKLKLPVIKALKNAEILTAYDLVNTPINQFSKIKSIGNKSVNEIKIVISDLLKNDFIDNKRNITNSASQEKSTVEATEYLGEATPSYRTGVKKIRIVDVQKSDTDDSIDNLRLSPRSRNVLKNNGITTIEKLKKTPIENIKRFRGAGKSTIAEIQSIDWGTINTTKEIPHSTGSCFYSNQIYNETIGNKYKTFFESVSISDLKLDTRTRNCLTRLDIKNLYQVLMTEDSVLKTSKNFGNNCYDLLIREISNFIKDEKHIEKLIKEKNKKKKSLNTEVKKEKLLRGIKISSFTTSTRVKNMLTNLNITDAYQLTTTPFYVYERYRNTGKKTLEEIKILIDNLLKSVNQKAIISETKKISDFKFLSDVKDLLETKGIFTIDQFLNYPLRNYRKLNNDCKKNILEIYSNIVTTEVLFQYYLFGNNIFYLIDDFEIVNYIGIEKLNVCNEIKSKLNKERIRDVFALLNRPYVILLKLFTEAELYELEDAIISISIVNPGEKIKVSQKERHIINSITKDVKENTKIDFSKYAFPKNAYLSVIQNNEIHNFLNTLSQDEIETIIYDDNFISLLYSDDNLLRYADFLIKNTLSTKRYEKNYLKQNLPLHFIKTDFFNTRINYLLKIKSILYKNKTYYNYIPTYRDYLNSLVDSNMKKICLQRLNGDSLEEVGITFSLTRERIRQIEHKLMARKPQVYEDTFKDIYEEYNIPRDVFEYLFEENPDIYRYLRLTYKRGESDLQRIFKDRMIPDYIKIRYEKYLDLNKIELNGTKINKDKLTLLRYYVRFYCQEPVKYDSFIDNYNNFILANKNIPNDFCIERRTWGNRFPLLDFIVWCQWKSFRYFDKTVINPKRFIHQLNLNIYKNIDITTKIIFEQNLSLMNEYDIRDEYELHNLLRTFENYIPKYLRVTLTRSPGICFGKGDRLEQLKQLIEQYPNYPDSEIARLFEKKYGYLAQTVSATFFKDLPTRERPYHGLKRNFIFNESEDRKEASILENFKKYLTKEIYSVDQINELFSIKFPNQKLLSGYDIKFLGYNYSSNLIYKDDYNSLSDYVNSLLSRNDIIDFSSEFSYLLEIGSFYNIINSMQKDFRIVEFSPKQFINVNRLKVLDVTKEDLLDFCTEVESYIGIKYFSIFYLKNTGFSHKIDSLGFDNIFYESLLKAHSMCKSTSLGYTKIFRFTNKQFNISDFFVSILEHEKKLELYDMQQLLENKYGIEVSIERIISITQNSELYYSDTMETIYIDYDEFYKEF